MIDVIELKAENLDLRRRLSLACGAAGVGIWEFDFVRDKLWVSDELASIYGLDANDLTWSEFLSRLHPSDVVAELTRPTPSYPFGEVNEFLIRVRHADGEFRTVRSRSVTYGEDDVPTRKVGVHIDMSQDALLRLTSELAEANERLRNFAYLASHDLRSPLRVIDGLVTMAIEDGEDLPDDIIELLEKAQKKSKGMVRLISELRDYAVGDLETVSAAPCDINRLIGNAVDTLDSGAVDIEVDSTISGRCTVAASPLSTCVRNLVDNACKHHHRPDGRVTISAECDDLWLTIAVADDGPGIAESEQAKIFEPFYTTDATQGTGLGLAFVARTAAKYLATLDCDSELDRGTTFTLRWPLSPDD